MYPWRSRTRLLLLAAGFMLGWARITTAGNATVPVALTSYTTIESAGFEWRISGDDNQNCVVTVEYRPQGSTAWTPAQPLWRVETGLWHHGEDPGNLLAGSLFFLSPATTYDVRLTLSDPDGGSAQQIVSVTTRAEPWPDPAGRFRYVVPGNGGGTGSLADPFRGLPAADAAAEPGDVFVVEPGTFATPFVPTRDGTADHPIAYLGVDPTVVVLDGLGSTDAGAHCIDLSRRQYVQVQTMTLRNCLRPVLAYGATGVVIRGCTIEPVHQLLSTVAISADSVRDLYLADNTLLMPGDWANVGRTGSYGTGGYGVETTGNGIVITHNRVVESWDAFDVGGGNGSGYRTFNCDVYENFVDRASDDACQTDAVHQNVRVFRNRFLNCGCAVSCQPCFGGPCYFLYNEIYNCRIDPFKYHQETFYYGASDPQETSGMIAFHNTVVCSKAAWYESGLWHHVTHRNNLLLGGRANIYSLYVAGGQRGDLDYNGYARQQPELVKYNNAGYATLPAFDSGAGQEQHGREVTFLEFVNAPVPVHPDWDWTQGYGLPYSPSDYDLQLVPVSVAVDAGQVLPNINDGYAGAAPDLGCYERGRAVPAYGPRALTTIGVPGLPPADGSVLRLLPPNPSPARGPIEFALESGRAVVVSVWIADAAGRSVRSLMDDQPLAGGVHPLSWDLATDSGAPAPSGIYYLRVRADGTTLARKITLLR